MGDAMLTLSPLPSSVGAPGGLAIVTVFSWPANSSLSPVREEYSAHLAAVEFLHLTDWWSGDSLGSQPLILENPSNYLEVMTSVVPVLSNQPGFRHVTDILGSHLTISTWYSGVEVARKLVVVGEHRCSLFC